MMSLLKKRQEKFSRGWVFRCKGLYPHEAIVDLILREDLHSPSEFTVMVLSGYKSGCDLVQLPSEAGSLSKGISADWLVENWEKWVYESKVEDVLCYRYPIAGEEMKIFGDNNTE